MIINFSSKAGLSLQEPEEFRSFKLLTDAPVDAIPQSAGLRFEGHDVAWISSSLVRSLRGAPIPAHWEEAFSTMVQKAAKYGWVNADGEIRAHVEQS